MTVAQLGLAVDSRQASQAAVDLDKLAASAAKADSAAAGLATGAKRGETATGQLAAAVRSAAGGAETATGALNRHASAVLMDGRAADTATSMMHRHTQAMNDNAKVSRELAFQRRNLSFQLLDISQSLAMGMPPLMVALQQGPQIAQIWGASEGGIGRAFAETARMVGRFTVAALPAAAAVGVVALAFAGLTREINQTSKVQVSFFDTLVATAEVSGEAILRALKPIWEGIQNGFGTLWDFIQPSLKLVGNGIIASFVGAYEHVKFLFGDSGAGLGNIIAAGVIGGANLAIAGINALIEKATQGINEVIKLANNIPGVDISELSTAPAIAPIDNPAFRNAQKLTNERDSNISKAFATDYLGDAFDTIAKRAREVSQRPSEKETEKARKESERQVEAYNRLTMSAQQYIEQQDRERQSIGLTAEETARLRYEQDLLHQAANDNIDLSPKQVAELKALAAQMAETETATAKLREAYDDAKQTSTGFWQDFAAGIIDGQSAWESFADAAVNALTKISDKMIETVANSAFDALFGGSVSSGGGIGGFLTSLFGGGSTPLGMGGIGANANGNAFLGGNVIPFARGGVVSSPTLFPMAAGAGLMGEAGPEAIMPLKRGADGRLGVAGASGDTVNVPIEISIDARGADEAGLARVERQIAQLRREVPGLAVRGVQEARRRNAQV